MISSSQQFAVAELTKISEARRQSVLIEGPPGCGKSYLAKFYANQLGISEYHVVPPKVAEIRDALDASAQVQNPVLLEVSNLDTGVAAASYTLLKSLEEPLPNLFIIITCRNMQAVPDTIISRSVVINVGPPTNSDIDIYGQSVNPARFNAVSSRLVWQCVRSFTDAEDVLNMSPEEIDYYESLAELCKFKDSVSNIVWKLGHYDSNKECNVELAIRSIAELMKNPFITRCGIECIRELNKGRIAPHAVLSKFVFDAKYCE